MRTEPAAVVQESFARTIREVHGRVGERWLTELPRILDECCARWGLRLDSPFPDLSYNYVAPAVRADGSEAVLKVGVPWHELLSEMRALRAFAGRGVVRLLDSDEERGALLLERLRPGEALAGPPDLTLPIAAEMMRGLWVPVPAEHSFRSVGDWIASMQEMAPRSLTAPAGAAFPCEWIERAVGLAAELEETAETPVLLHGDLHGGNILSHAGDWRVIDAWGIVGERAWEPGPFLLNAVSAAQSGPERKAVLLPLVEEFAAGLSLDAERIRRCSVVRAVISALWMLEDHGSGWENALLTAGALDG